MPDRLASTPMPRRTRPISAEQRRHVEQIIVAASTHRAELGRHGPDPATDPVGAIAWLARLLGPYSPEVVALVGRARAQHVIEWREIALAVRIDPDEPVAVRQMANNYRRHLLS